MLDPLSPPLSMQRRKPPDHRGGSESQGTCHGNAGEWKQKQSHALSNDRPPQALPRPSSPQTAVKLLQEATARKRSHDQSTSESAHGAVGSLEGEKVRRQTRW